MSSRSTGFSRGMITGVQANRSTWNATGERSAARGVMEEEAILPDAARAFRGRADAL